MDQEILQAINAKLNSDYKLVKQFGSGIANLNYLLENSSGTRIVARILKEQKTENLEFESRIQAKLKESGIGSPQLLKNPDGSVLLLSLKEINITFTNYVESDPHPKIFPVELLPDLGRTLARLQQALQDLPEDEVPENYLSKSYQNKLKFRKKDQQIAKEIKNYIGNLYKKISKLNLPKTTIHGDLNEGNILIKNNQIIAILDFETVEYKERILDLGILVYYRQPDSNLSYPEVATRIISGFEEVAKLRSREKEAMPLATQYTAACFSLWSLANEESDPNYDFLKGFHDLQQKIEDEFTPLQ